MKHEMKHAVFIAALLALGLTGCQKSEEHPLPEVSGYEPPVAENFPADPNPMTELPPSEMAPSMGGQSGEPASGGMPDG